MTVQILKGNCRDVLRTLPAESVHCVVTSPPYWGLRDYGTAPAIWGGVVTCDHDFEERRWYTEQSAAKTNGSVEAFSKPGAANAQRLKDARWRTDGTCVKCGAWRGSFGLEPTYQMFVDHAVEVFREVRRVLRPDGTLWLNLGDSYCSGGRATWRSGASENKGQDVLNDMPRPAQPADLKPKDLIGIPWRVAFALQADGWWLRQDIIWCLSGGAWLYARTASGDGPVMLKDLVRLAPETVQLWNGDKWTNVTAWTRRKGRADAVEIVLRSGERIGCTGNHVWPTERGDLRTSELHIGDKLKSAPLPPGDLPAGWLTDDAFWFAGLFIAEGSRSGETIQISGHVKEVDRLARVRSLISHYGGSARAYTEGRCQNIHIDSVAVSAILRVLVAGRTAKDKRLTSAAWQYPNWQIRKLVEGYLDGDGHFDGERVRLGFCRNYSLERDLRCLAARLGATISLKPTKSKNQSGKSFPSFKGEWRWERSGHRNERSRDEIVEIRRSRARQFWDVSVADEPHLFALASGVLTHNSKPNPMPESVTDRCTKAHEYLFMLSKSEQYYFDQEAILEPVSASTVERLSQPGLGDQEGSWRVPGKTNGPMKAVARQPRGKAITSPRQDGNSWNENNGRGFMPERDGRNKRSVWTVTTQPFSEAHFATFPPALIEPCILAGCPQGGTVLDPFGGAGTTGLVADRLGRNAILIELNSKYADMAERRISGDGGMFASVEVSHGT